MVGSKGGMEVLHIIDSALRHGWCEAYDKEELPSGYAFNSTASGRSPIYGERMSSITIKIPLAQKRVLEKEAQNAGASLSSYVREIIATR